MARISLISPTVLSMTTRQVDGKLGFLQKEFFLSGKEVREVATKAPKIIPWPVKKIKVSNAGILGCVGCGEKEAPQ